MGIKRQSDGTWTAFYSKRHPITKSPVGLRRRRIESKAKAVRIEKELIALVSERLKATIVPTWSKLVEEYLEFCRLEGMTTKAIYNREKCLGSATSSWDERSIDSITSMDIRRVIVVGLQDRSRSQQKSVLQYIRCVFRFACEKNYLARDPTPKMAFRIGDRIKKVLTEEEVRHLLNKAAAAGWKWYPHYAFAVYTGMRSGEMYALTWDKVDLGRRLIVVNCSWNNKDGLKCTKSGDDRIVPH